MALAGTCISAIAFVLFIVKKPTPSDHAFPFGLEGHTKASSPRIFLNGREIKVTIMAYLLTSHLLLLLREGHLSAKVTVVLLQ